MSSKIQQAVSLIANLATIATCAIMFYPSLPKLTTWPWMAIVVGFYCIQKVYFAWKLEPYLVVLTKLVVDACASLIFSILFYLSFAAGAKLDPNKPAILNESLLCCIALGITSFALQMKTTLLAEAIDRRIARLPID